MNESTNSPASFFILIKFSQRNPRLRAGARMSSYKIEIVPVPRSLISEGPHWDGRTQELLYADIYGQSVHRYNPKTGQERKVVIEGAGGDKKQFPLSFVIPVQSQPDTFLIACEGSICVLKWPPGNEAVQKMNRSQLRVLHSVPVHDPPVTINDAKCDSKGRLWAGSLCVRILPDGWEMVKGVGHIYRLDLDGQFTAHVDGVDLSNGIAWSLDSKQFYYVDTAYPRIDGFDYDLERGTISNRRTVFDLKVHGIEGVPDGMCTDENGNLWVALYEGGKVINVDPRTGNLLASVEFPNKKITSCAFGGPNLDELYVTSARFGMTDQEAEAVDAGSLYKVTGLGVKGSSAGVAYAGKV